MENTVNERIRKIIEYLGISETKFAKKIGVTQSVISSMFKRNTDPSYKLMYAITNAYEFISAEWLLTGEGEMLKSDFENSQDATAYNKSEIDNMPEPSVVLQRIEEIIKYKELSVTAFATKIGMAQTTVNNYLLGRRKPSFELIECISNSFEEISIEWLFRGEGSMLKNISENSGNLSEQKNDGTRNNDIVNTNEDVPMSEILEFMKLVSTNMDNQLKSFNQQMSEQRAEMKEQRAMMMVELKEQRLSMMTELKEQRVATINQFEKLYNMMEKQFTELAKRNHDESEILKTMVNKIAQVDEKTGRIIQLQKGVG